MIDSLMQNANPVGIATCESRFMFVFSCSEDDWFQLIIKLDTKERCGCLGRGSARSLT